MAMRVEVSQRLPKQPQRIAASNGVFEAAISLHLRIPVIVISQSG
jgi:hypothetical protein